MSDPTSAGLAQALLDAETERQEHQAESTRHVRLPDERLPGVGDPTSPPLTLGQGVRIGGVFTLVMLVLLQAFSELESAVLTVLAPDLRDALHVSNGVIVFISAASGAFLALGSYPLGWLADRHRRSRVIGWATALGAVAVFSGGLATSAFALFLARLGVGVSKANALPVQGSLAADAFPIGLRGRISGVVGSAARLAVVLSPAVVGGIAALAGGSAGWRWAFLLLALPLIPLAVLAFRLPEPTRGRHEKEAVLGQAVVAQPVGQAVAQPADAAIPLNAAFARLRQIRTFKMALLALAAIGFALITGPVLSNLYLDEHFHLGTFGRGLVGSLTAAGALVVLPLLGARYDQRYRHDPAQAVRLLGVLLVPAGILLPVQYAMPDATLFAVVGAVPTVLVIAAFALAVPVLQSIVPYRLRGQGLAIGAIALFGVGATGGGVLAAGLTNALGPAGAVLVVGIPSLVLGGLLVLRRADTVKDDLSSVVTELGEEEAERRRQQDEPDAVPALQVSGIDYAYGHVQVLFDVTFEVRTGEVLALLGTNGAGKSTILRVIAGLGAPSRGVVRLDGTTITYVAPEQRVRMGIRLLPGGKGVFPQMTVRENLEMGAYIYRRDPADRERRIARVLELFAELGHHQGQTAGSLSGGQQQMLALAITLLHDPDVLLIDELSLGLSPIVVQQLMGIIEQLKAEGMTIVIVEQSLNVALALADRAVFMEKGQVRFEGRAQELAERDDLARAVFLGRDA